MYRGNYNYANFMSYNYAFIAHQSSLKFKAKKPISLGMQMLITKQNLSPLHRMATTATERTIRTQDIHTKYCKTISF